MKEIDLPTLIAGLIICIIVFILTISVFGDYNLSGMSMIATSILYVNSLKS